MKSAIATSVLLLATTVAAAPYTQRRMEAYRQRLARRAAGLTRTSMPLAVNYTSLDDTIKIESNSAEVSYSSNWAGAVQISTGITEVSATANFPTVTVPSGSSSRTEYGGSAWVGIDGETCQSSILQTGIDWVIEGSQSAYEAWYEWLPEYSYSFDIDVSPGDQISMRVVANSKTAGTAYIENLTTGVTVSHTFSGETALCEENAEWIVEDFSVVSSSGSATLIPFAEFSTVTFTDAEYVHGGTTSGVSGSTILDIEQNGKILTSCSTSGSSEVVCEYTG